MHAASREALAAVISHTDALLESAEQPVASAAQAGTELCDVVELLSQHRQLRTTLADSAISAEASDGIISRLFEQKLSALSCQVLTAAARQRWSSASEFCTGISSLAQHCLLKAAEAEGQLQRVESELIGFARILENHPELTQLLSDGTQEASRRRQLCAQVLYGKVTAVAEALILDAVTRPQGHLVDAIRDRAHTAAQLQNRDIALVTTSVELTEQQRESLAQKLAHIYGREMNIHTEVDPELLGGAVIRVGNEIIDGSTSGALARLRQALS